MNSNLDASDIRSAVKAAIEKHGAEYDGLIPILLDINKTFGYIPVQAIKEVRRSVHLPEERIFISEGRLFALASFYHMLSTQPRGEHVIVFCESAPCHVVGGRKVRQSLQDVLQIKIGETTPDGKWSLIATSCLGVCSVGPVILVDDDMYSNVSPGQIPEILAKYS